MNYQQNFRGFRSNITSATDKGMIRWTGSDFQGYDGSNWISLTSGLWAEHRTYISPNK